MDATAIFRRSFAFPPHSAHHSADSSQPFLRINMTRHSSLFRFVQILACATIIGSGFALADPTTQPTTQPARPVMVNGKQTNVTRPDADAGKDNLTNSLHELASKIHQLDNQTEKAPKVACFDLASKVEEKASDFSLFSTSPADLTLRTLIDRLHHARDDKEVRAVLLRLGDPGTNLSQSQEIRDALLEIKSAGKKAFVYADGYDTDTYTIASGATNICILSGGEIMIPGVGIQTMYLKNLFDKLGVKADYVQIGDYKGADEMFTRTGPSTEFTGELNKLVDGLYRQVVDGIATHRNLPADQVKAAIDESIMTAQSAKDRGLVDNLVDVDGLQDLITDEMGTKVEMVDDYDAPAKESLDFSSPFALLALLAKKPAVSNKPSVAIVYADGVIVDGPGGAGIGSLLDGETIGSDTIREAMRTIAKDASIKAVVIRINSPGGSALASEAMWQSVRRIAKDKPVVISVGNMAASGGYYLACAGDRIFADPSAIVGSIGVVGGKFVTKDLFDKLGITTATFTRGKNADLFGSNTEFTDKQRKMVKSWMTETYDQFTSRVMSTRGGKIKKIEDVAQGRVFIADQAKDLGLIDEIGGTDKAIAYAADQAHLKPEAYEVKVVPAAKTLIDLLSGTGSGPSTSSPIASRIQISEDSVLKAMPKEVRSMVGEQLQILRLLQERPVVLAAPFAVREK
jgi:protease-4